MARFRRPAESGRAAAMHRGAVQICLNLATGFGALVVFIGACGLIGWASDVPGLKGAFAGGIMIKANTALGLVLCGVALLLLRETAAEVRWRQWGARVCALTVAVLGGLTLIEHIGGFDFGIDQLLFMEPAGAPATASPGRMGPPAAMCFLLAGMALMRLALSWKSRGLGAQLLGAVVCLIALVPLVGYIFGADQLYGFVRDKDNSSVAGYEKSLELWPTASFHNLNSPGSRPFRNTSSYMSADSIPPDP